MYSALFRCYRTGGLIWRRYDNLEGSGGGRSEGRRSALAIPPVPRSRVDRRHSVDLVAAAVAWYFAALSARSLDYGAHLLGVGELTHRLVEIMEEIRAFRVGRHEAHQRDRSPTGALSRSTVIGTSIRAFHWVTSYCLDRDLPTTIGARARI